MALGYTNPITHPHRKVRDPWYLPRLTSPLLDRGENLRHNFGARLRAKISLAVNANAHSIGLDVALSNHKHGMHLHLFGPLDFAVDLIAAVVDFRADLMSAQFVQN